MLFLAFPPTLFLFLVTNPPILYYSPPFTVFISHLWPTYAIFRPFSHHNWPPLVTRTLFPAKTEPFSRQSAVYIYGCDSRLLLTSFTVLELSCSLRYFTNLPFLISLVLFSQQLYHISFMNSAFLVLYLFLLFLINFASQIVFYVVLAIFLRQFVFFEQNIELAIKDGELRENGV